MAKIKDMCALSSSTDAEVHELVNEDHVLPCDGSLMQLLKGGSAADLKGPSLASLFCKQTLPY